MALSQMDNFTFKHSDQQDAIYTQYTAQQIKSLFDSRGDELKTALNLLITTLKSTEGATDIGTSTIQDIDGVNIQAMLQSIRDKLKSVADGTSGADYINATTIAGLSGSTVQTILEALKTYVDNADTANIDNLTAHKTSSDHDTRYFTKDQLQSISAGTSGADQINATSIAVGSGNTVQAQLAWLLSQIAVAATGSIPDGSLTEAKLAQALVNKINTALSNTGVLTTLTTTDKSSAVNAINEVLNNLTSHLADYMSYASAKVEDVYTVVDFKRADNTLYLKSTLSNPDTNGYFQTCTLNYYDNVGTTIINTVTWTFTYDTDGNIITKVVV